jgi:hypothetical protein
LSFAEFWALTPADVVLAMDAHDRRERAAYWRAGLVAATVANVHREKGRKAFDPEDFIPRRAEPATAATTPEQMAAALRAFTLMLGGEVTGPPVA